MVIKEEKKPVIYAVCVGLCACANCKIEFLPLQIVDFFLQNRMRTTHVYNPNGCCDMTYTIVSSVAMPIFIKEA